jgi:hypothetical protein
MRVISRFANPKTGYLGEIDADRVDIVARLHLTLVLNLSCWTERCGQKNRLEGKKFSI